MRTTFRLLLLGLIGVGLALGGCSPATPVATPKAAPADSPATAVSTASPAPTKTANVDDKAKSKADESQATAQTEKTPASSLQPLTDAEQDQLLHTRLSGGMGNTFGQFANMFLVSSRLQLGTGVGLMTSSQEIAKMQLQSPFPESYEPTLRELMDAIALQTFSSWKYDPSDKYFQSDVPHKSPVTGLAMFEFTKTKREKPYAVTLAEKWTTVDHGNWVMHVPPTFPVGMDIYEMGTYSDSDDAKTKELYEKIRGDVALEWAQRVNDKAKREDLKPAKVGEYDALYYESLIPSQLDKDIRWRHWVFMVDNQCYFIVSTILPEFEAKIYPDVEKMLASFRMK